jgi:oligopeptide/dipeptide ABC transporter ATP-binding protein
LSTLLEVRDLHVSFKTPDGIVRAVNGVSFSLEQGATLGVVGESGSGKTVMTRALMSMLPLRGVTREGRVVLDGQDMFALKWGDLRKILGKTVALIPQTPMASLNPVMTVGQQIGESLKEHLGITGPQAKRKALELMSSVRIPEAARRLDEYPHQMSGGMCQRVMIAIALACEPKLLIADEPTTALDVTIQAQILDLLKELQVERQMAMILVTHNLGVAASCTDRIGVMYGGRFVEVASTKDLFSRHRMPYTEALLQAIPRVDRAVGSRFNAIPGQPPDPARHPPGCAFAPRCAFATERCQRVAPELTPSESRDHVFACWNPLPLPDPRPVARLA